VSEGQAPAPRQIITPPPVTESQQVGVVLRFNPEYLTRYFENVKSLQQFVKAYEALTGVKLDEWERRLLEMAWYSVSLGTVPLMEVFPISNVPAYVKTFANEVLMHTENLKNFVSKKMSSCVELARALKDYVDKGVDEVGHQLEECRKLVELSPHLTLILSIFIVEHTHRKAQFSLPINLMPNSAKGVTGMWSD
jgi:hypothetical protein